MLYLDKWGGMALENLRNSRPDLLKSLRDSGQLDAHLEEVQEQAGEQFEQILSDLKLRDPVPKGTEAMARAHHLQRHWMTANEIVVNGVRQRWQKSLNINT